MSTNILFNNKKDPYLSSSESNEGHSSGLGVDLVH